MFKVAVAAFVVAFTVANVPHVAMAVCWHAPVNAAVADPFREPACAWCPGNRGIEYDTVRGARVRAVATGRVTFAGSIAGTVYVVVEHSNGWRTTYGNLIATSHDAGDLVVRGSIIGHAAGHLHFGLRDGDRYLDPAPYLGELRGVPRLIPVDGTAPHPSRRVRLVCG